ncbi:MAG: hypothetical protein N2651_08945 [Fimbriimonadales bacterium]|nr:hypothetical protein [Fimbriimonadales bacterium]
MNTLERQSLAVYAMVGGVVGFLLGLLPPIILNWSVGVLFATIALGIALGAGVGFWLGQLINRRFPPMLPFHAREHKRLRETAQRVRQNLRRLTGLKREYPELDTILKHDAQLRVQASELRLQMDAKVRAALHWGDYLSGAIDTLRTGGWRELLSVIVDSIKEQSEGEASPTNTRSEWIWGVYHAKIQREVMQIQEKQTRAHSDTERDALRHARAAKERELQSFQTIERALREIESASAAIVAQMEHLYTETVRLSAQPHHAAQRVEELLQPMCQQVEAYEQAVSELQSISVGAQRE